MGLEFNIALLRKQIKHRSHTPEGLIVCSGDTAFTANEKSDRSVLFAGVITEQTPMTLWLTDSVADRIEPENLPKTIVDFFDKNKPTRTVFEQVNGTVFLNMAVREHALRRGIAVPKIGWYPAKRIRGSKVHRVESLIKLHLEDRLRLVSSPWAYLLVEEAERWTGTVKNKGRRDDLLDSAAMLTKFII